MTIKLIQITRLQIQKLPINCKYNILDVYIINLDSDIEPGLIFLVTTYPRHPEELTTKDPRIWHRATLRRTLADSG